MKLLVVNNLVSGYREGGIYDFLRAFAEDGDDLTLRNTDGTTPIDALLADAETFDAVVASGGDGTVAAVAHLLADTGIPILPFPAGTANLLTVNLEAPEEPHALATLARFGETMDFDLGVIEFEDGTQSGFSLMAGAGYDATIMEAAQPGKPLLGQVAYFTAALTNPTPQFSRIRLTVDDQVIESDGLGVLIVNFSRMQFEISVVHNNDPRDGLFDVVILHTRDAFGLIPALLAGLLDREGGFPSRTDALEIYRGARVEVVADPPLPIQFDGEVSEHNTPFKAHILPEAARFIVSDECVALYS